MKKPALFAAVTGILEFAVVLLVNYFRYQGLPFAVWVAAIITGLVGGFLLFFLLRISARRTRQ